MGNAIPILWAIKIFGIVLAVALFMVIVVYVFGPTMSRVGDMGDNVSASLGVQANQSVVLSKEVHTDEDTNTDLRTVAIALPVILMVFLYIWYYQRKHGCTPAEAIRRELRGGPKRRYK